MIYSNHYVAKTRDRNTLKFERIYIKYRRFPELIAYALYVTQNHGIITHYHSILVLKRYRKYSLPDIIENIYRRVEWLPTVEKTLQGFFDDLYDLMQSYGFKKYRKTCVRIKEHFVDVEVIIVTLTTDKLLGHTTFYINKEENKDE